MVVKFFKNRKGGSSKSIDYLLNKREQEGTAKVLQGDPDLTRKIIKTITNKQKVTVGCLSFSEADIAEDLKRELMQDFERTLLAGLDRDQYNVLWVEHTDKGRLELNFVIPKIELTTGKALQPYFDRADRPRVEMWQQYQNTIHGFSNPQDPARAQTIQGSRKEVNLFKDYQALDNTLHDLVHQGKINNREQMIELLEANGIEITRKGSDYLSVKLPESKRAKRLKGGIYSEQFASITSIEEISREAAARARQFRERDTQGELEATRERLDRFTHEKAQSNSRKYAQRASEAPKASVEAHSPDRNVIVPSRVDNRERDLDDRVRKSVADRIRSREEVLREAISDNHRTREEIHLAVSGGGEELFREARTALSERRERRTAREYLSRAIEEFRGTFDSIGERLRQQVQSIRQRIGAGLQQCAEQSEHTTRSYQQQIDRDRSFGMRR